MTGRAMSAGTAETRSGSGRQPASAVANGDGPQPTDNRENTVTTSEQQAVPVAQGDREAAAQLVEWHNKVAHEWETVNGGTMQFFTNAMPRATRAGTWDEHAFVQAFARHRLDATQTREAEGVSVAEYNEVYDKFEEVVSGAFRDGFREGWVFAQAPDGTDYDDRQEEYGRTVDIEPSEAWEGYRDKYAAMLPVPALPALNARGGA